MTTTSNNSIAAADNATVKFSQRAGAPAGFIPTHCEGYIF